MFSFLLGINPEEELLGNMITVRASLVAQLVKNLPAMWENWVQSLVRKMGMATHSSTFAWRNPWTEEPGGLQSSGSQRVGHD